MCARTIDDAFSNGSDCSPCDTDIPETGNGATSCMTSSAEFAVSLRPRRLRRAIPPAWRYSLPSTITAPRNTTPTAISGSGHDNESVFGAAGRRRPLCKYAATAAAAASRNVAESGPRIRPTCLRYSYWLTLDDRRFVLSAGEFFGNEDQLRKRHFLPRSCEIDSDIREPFLCRRTVSSRNGELAPSSDDYEGPIRHVTGSRASRPTISWSASASDVAATGHSARSTPPRSANLSCPSVCLNHDRDRHDGGAEPDSAGNDVIVDRSHDEVEGQRRLSLSKIGDSGLGASIHSEQTSPDETDEQTSHADDISQCQGQCRGETQGHIPDADTDDWAKLTGHKCEYA